MKQATTTRKGSTMTSTTKPRYSEIEVDLVGEDGNAFAILGRVLGAMRRAGVSDRIRGQFQNEATRGDYDHLLQTCVKWVTCN